MSNIPVYLTLATSYPGGQLPFLFAFIWIISGLVGAFYMLGSIAAFLFKRLYDFRPKACRNSLWAFTVSLVSSVLVFVPEAIDYYQEYHNLNKIGKEAWGYLGIWIFSGSLLVVSILVYLYHRYRGSQAPTR